MKISSWNVNSVRARLNHLLRWLDAEQPDIVAIQETKVVDELFPQDILVQAGYETIYCGQKSYNGVAILSKLPITNASYNVLPAFAAEKRILLASIGELRICNVYVPNGAAVDSVKYQDKLLWLTQLHQFLASELISHPQLIVLGDFNIAPADIDVYNPQAFVGSVLCSTLEREKFHALLELGFIDCYRFHYPTTPSYTWWDYRLNSFKRNMGLRIDHILLSSALNNKNFECIIDTMPRSWSQPSDHAPITVVL